MVDGRTREQWNHTSELLAMIANTARNPKKRNRPFVGREFHPDARRRKREQPVEKAPITALRAAFVGS